MAESSPLRALGISRLAGRVGHRLRQDYGEDFCVVPGNRPHQDVYLSFSGVRIALALGQGKNPVVRVQGERAASGKDLDRLVARVAAIVWVRLQARRELNSLMADRVFRENA